MTRALLITALALSVACKPEDASGTWVGSTENSVLGVETRYDMDFDMERDEDKLLVGEGIMLVGNEEMPITIEGQQKRKKVEFEVFAYDTDLVLLTTKYKGKIKEGEIDGKLSIGVSLARVKSELLLERQ